MKNFDKNSQWYVGYELKSKYQRNYLIGIIVANGFLVLMIMLYIIWYEINSNESQFQIFFDNNVNSEVHNISGQSKFAGHGSTSKALTELKDMIPDGYIGTFKIDKNYQTVKLVLNDDLKIDILEPALESYSTNSFEIGQENGKDAFYGSGTGDDNYGFPDNEPYMPKLHFNSIDRFNDSIEELSNQAAIVLIPSPMWPPRARYTDTGLVEVGLVIDTKGHISWNILSESPSGKGFALELVEALKRGRYSPAVKNGQKSEIYLRLSCMFCYSCEPSLKSSSNNVLAGILK